ncbi:pesticin C-terminus-like muramidase [Pseudomonas mangiferae]|uniref:Pesticin C-terminal domain-containing protein n=1 Tax=Pseudomonas mangiferae TaxID=2593654 RepID=A0A553GTE0_9PSED|nr:pesticin C-terminus-like muramidase [Pseudomonas mangiferae]TRX72720.1 hypothetical protein FM069_21430 [Pseudomonas mangiferae]
MSKTVPAPLVDTEEIKTAQAEKTRNDKTAEVANKNRADAEKAYKDIAKKAEGANKKADEAASTARKHPSAKNQQRADAAQANADTATSKLEQARTKLEDAYAKAAEAAKAKAESDAAYAKLKNEQLQKSMPSEEFDEVLRQIELNCGVGHFVDGVVKPCPGRFKKRNCAGTSPPDTQRLSTTAQEAINKDTGTSIDYDKLAEFEGGQATSAYVPWWPKGMKINDGAITVDTTRAKGTEELAGDNQSGVTVGTGVDLGQQDKKVYFERLKKAGATQDLLDKLDPYMGLKRSAACRYLREHPLTLTQEEVDLIDSEMQKEKINAVKDVFNDYTLKKGYNINFDDLSEAERTILMSRQYNKGNLDSSADKNLMLYFSQNKEMDAVATLTAENYPGMNTRIKKEHDYLEGSYANEKQAQP